MENKLQHDTQYEDEIDLRELFGALWAEKIKILAITTIFAVASLIYSLSIPNQYKATAILAPASDGGGLSDTLGQLSGLAILGGMSIGGGESSESQIAQEIMRSWSFIEDFIVENDIAVEIYAAEGWSKESNELKIDQAVYDSEEKEWLIENDSGVVGPSSWELFEEFTERLAVSEDNKTGFVSVSIEYYSPQIAKQWLDLYISAINKNMQMREIEKVSNNISYLETQINKTAIAEMREVFYTLIAEQTKDKMVAEASPEYAFVAVSPSMVPEEKSQPQRILICALGTILGGMLSVLLLSVMHFIRKSD